jgi:hypothetical protein
VRTSVYLGGRDDLGPFSRETFVVVAKHMDDNVESGLEGGW